MNFTLLNIQNISELGTDVIEEFFYGISVKEILKLSVINTTFSEACKRESFWKKKVLLDYGVEKKYGETWKETAILLSDSNMINLGKEWVDGQTYGELLEEGMSIEPFFYPCLREFNIFNVDDLKNAEYLQHVLKLVTREFSVIMHVIGEIRGYYNLFSLSQECDVNELTDNELKVANKIKSLVDPIPYVMTYSLQTLKTLNTIKSVIIQ
uniref:F-box family protein n=1 Tax=Pithovirus LCPAC401 TaxID=2506595 RepID=A0A481ZA07_9VIRU|nr:MAG: F-box family protein [Pithovirus LCPAC401]